MKDDVIIRGSAKQGISILLNDQTDFSTARRRLQERLEATNGFFNGTEVTLDIGERQITPDQAEELEHLVKERGGASLVKMIVGPSSNGDITSTNDTVHVSVSSGTRAERRLNKPHAAPANRPQRPTMLLKRTLRSGQKINFDGNVVIVGDVNPGAEVIAGGDIVVMGTFRGVAHAGATGDESSIITAFNLQPTQLRISTIISRSPDDDGSRARCPEIAKVRNGLIIVEDMPTYG